ncbi:MAG: hypothetical protein KJ017_03895 [Alphaproteobacteria bacterium]|nr:hypothetical protein [Alphaproteobacteria bacterium]
MSVNEKDIETTLVLAARIVARYGETYLPIFERLEDELDAARTSATRLDRAIEIAREIRD